MISNCAFQRGTIIVKEEKDNKQTTKRENIKVYELIDLLLL